MNITCFGALLMNKLFLQLKFLIGDFMFWAALTNQAMNCIVPSS